MKNQEGTKVGVNSEYGELESVLLDSPRSIAQENVFPFEGNHPWLDSLPISPIEAGKDYADLYNHIEGVVGESGIKDIGKMVLRFFTEANPAEIKSFLYGAYGTAKADVYLSHIESRRTKLASRGATRLMLDVTLGYPLPDRLENGEVPACILPPRRTTYFTRDPLAITPIGFMVGSMSHDIRKHEPAFFKSMLTHFPEFGDETIAVDLLKMEEQDGRRYVLEGGNVQVYDKIVAIGIGKPDARFANRTNAAGAEAATKALFAADMEGKIEEIVHVYIPDYPSNIHLDSIFNMIGPKMAVAMPHMFGYPEKPEKYIRPIIDRIKTDMLVAGQDMSRFPQDTDYKKWGTATVYTRENLKKADDFESAGREVRFFDYLVEQGQLDLDKVCWVGGKYKEYLGDSYNMDHLRYAFLEQNSLAANVLAVEPFRAIAYSRNERTNFGIRMKLAGLALKDDLLTISSNEIRTTWGGPRCMALPISRKSV